VTDDHDTTPGDGSTAPDDDPTPEHGDPAPDGGGPGEPAARSDDATGESASGSDPDPDPDPDGRLRSLLRTLRRTLVPEGDLSTKAARSGVWMTALNVSSRVLEVGLLLVLARILPPSEFGLMGIALLTYAALERISTLGLESALIHRPDENVDDYLNTAFMLQLARGVALGSLLYLGAPLAARFFSEPQVVELLRFLSVGPVLYGLRNPGIVYFRKKLEFHRQFIFQFTGVFVYTATTLGFALTIGNVWALVYGYVAGEIGYLVASYVTHSFRPSLSFDRESAGELIGYGKWMTASGLIYFLVEQGDDFVVGWALAASALAYYQLAYRLANTPANEVTKVISNVVFPMYSKLQDDVEALREAFFRVAKLTTFVTFPMAVGIVVVAPQFVAGFLGEEWIPMTVALQLVAVYGLFYSLAALFGPVWQAVGRPDYGTKIGALRVAFMAVTVVPATRTYGIEGTAVVVIAAYVVAGLPADMYLLTRQLQTTYRRIAVELAYPVSASLAMGGVVYGVGRTLELGPAVEFFLLVPLGVAVYALAVLVLDRGFHWGIEQSARKLVAAVRGDSPTAPSNPSD
jgi:PST family polysaccharide transporter/lipopolysaccharide exporter